MGERLRNLPAREHCQPPPAKFDFRQDLAFDTTAIRRDLHYRDVISQDDAIARTLGAGPG